MAALQYFITMILAVFSLTACASCTTDNNEPSSDEPEKTDPSPDPTPGTTESGNVLIAYFSCTNTTKGIADEIASITKGTLFRIEAETPYTSADLDYNSDCRANREQNDPSARPAIKNRVDNIEKYDIIFLGYPIWWGAAPRIISTFLESYDFKGKILVPFCTSHSSSLGNSDRNLYSSAPGADWKPGKRFSAGASKSEVETWIESLNLNFNSNNKNDVNMNYSKFPL